MDAQKIWIACILLAVLLYNFTNRYEPVAVGQGAGMFVVDKMFGGVSWCVRGGCKTVTQE